MYVASTCGPERVTVARKGETGPRGAFRLPLGFSGQKHMPKIIAKRNANRCPMHPGEVLREDILPALRMSKSEVAEALGISRQHLTDILNEKKPVSAEVAVRFGKAFGDGTDIWLRMQAAYDAWHAERSVDVSKVVRIEAA